MFVIIFNKRLVWVAKVNGFWDLIPLEPSSVIASIRYIAGTDQFWVFSHFSGGVFKGVWLQSWLGFFLEDKENNNI